MSTVAVGRPHVSTCAAATPQAARARRGSSNRDARGNTKNRRARRRFLVDTYTADVPLVAAWYSDGQIRVTASPFVPDPGAAAWVATLERMSQAGRDAGWILPPPAVIVHTEVLKAARCYRCGCLLHAGSESPADGLPELEGTVTADRIVPGALGGTYRRENIRPACGPCQELTGGQLGAERRHGAPA